MSARPSETLNERVNTLDLRAALQRTMTAYYGQPVNVTDLARSPWDYRSSFALERLQVELQPGGALAVMFKDLSWQALTAEARHAKQSSSYDPLREIGVYQQILRSHPGYAPTCYGAVVDPSLDRYWLFIESIAGQELYQIGDFDVWLAVASRLAQMHAAFRSAIVANPRLIARLIKHDVQQQALSYRRASEVAAKSGDTAKTTALGELSRFLPAVAQALSARPPTLIHGEFYPSNILVAPSAGARQIYAIDWEMAGLSIGLLDLAALVAGRWSHDQQQALVSAYYETALQAGEIWQEAEFFKTLECCRLYMALRWLGNSDDWTPPPDHAHDWLNEALAAGKRLAQSVR